MLMKLTPSVDLQTNISCLLEQRGTYEQKPRLTERSKKSSRPYNYWVRSNNIAQAQAQEGQERNYSCHNF
jgi:hypothetical protein